jgi:2-polyprenyl-6-methoxyphenol hydroxylase-like FAD-dependent oxidoreductase
VPDFDIVVVGGGLAGSSFAIAMARHGAKVLVLEQESRFRDRIRGEYLCPWGAAEVGELGLRETFRAGGTCELPWVDMGSGPRDLVDTGKHQLPGISYSHPELQEALIEAAAKAGAVVRRGVTVEKLESGSRPTVECRGSNSAERITARLIVAADGRNSARRWAGFTSRRDDHPFLIAGVLLEGVSFRQDMCGFVFNPNAGTVTGTTPQGRGCTRAYFAYPSTWEYRIQGKDKVPLLLRESAKSTPFLADAYANARDVGPLASFDTNDSWVDHPYKDGVALIGDAAATSDPCFGQGMSLTMRDVRVLRDSLIANSDWDRAGHFYAEQHDTYFHRCHRACQMMRTVFQEQTPEAAFIRQRALPLIAEDPTRVPDHLIGGPELPVDDAVRARFFGES